MKHGHTWRDAAGRPGMSPTYRAWTNMLQRVRSHPRYAGRGITVCERWRDFAAFLADMGERPEGLTLDRIDNDGDYEPGNVRWADWSAQMKNRTQSPVSLANLARDVRAKSFKLTVEDVAWIKANAGQMTQRSMAARLGVSNRTISDVVRGRRWAAV